jgi:ankyrin repeat protein
MAGIKGRHQLVPILVNAGAQLERTDGKATALFMASKLGHFETVRALIRAGANIESTADGTTSLICLYNFISEQEQPHFLLQHIKDNMK